MIMGVSLKLADTVYVMKSRRFWWNMRRSNAVWRTRKQDYTQKLLRAVPPSLISRAPAAPVRE